MKRVAAVAVVSAALVLAGCGTNDPFPGGASNPPAETGQTTFICAGDTSGTLLQWNDLDGRLTGSYMYSELSGFAPNEGVSTSSRSPGR